VSEPLLIDGYLAVYDASIAEHAIVHAAPHVTYESARTLDFLAVHTPLLDAAMWVRGLPARLAGNAPPDPPRLVLGDGDPLPGWVVLGERPDRELVFGAVGRFWSPQIEWRDVARDDFAAFADPGWGKIVAGFEVSPYGADASLLTYECRTATTDDQARRDFARYSWLVRPFVAHIFRATVRTIRDRSEGAAEPRS